MNTKALSIRPFIGAKDYELSRKFYNAFGFQETILSPEMSVFNYGNIAFYLQNAFVEDWINNSMIFLEVVDLDVTWQEISALNLPAKFSSVRVSAIKNDNWGREFFVHDPCGILWHIGTFHK